MVLLHFPEMLLTFAVLSCCLYSDAHVTIVTVDDVSSCSDYCKPVSCMSALKPVEGAYCSICSHHCFSCIICACNDSIGFILQRFSYIFLIWSETIMRLGNTVIAELSLAILAPELRSIRTIRVKAIHFGTDHFRLHVFEPRSTI